MYLKHFRNNSIECDPPAPSVISDFVNYSTSVQLTSATNPRQFNNKITTRVKKEQTPPLIDFSLDDNKMLCVQENPVTINSKKAGSKKDWDDDAWELLNQ
ncbi:hypothetical protein LOAG_12860 [Loa loa]|uniref:Uncharacterized protein n=1 Tax=Loa loa TaxID=7209 RepID=A0A1S0TKG0_LOALO|nr:hypothetical protein LOAG_12860 [Loa loa]EFO15649.2 hypothetical protein LOAG_12860 [Loa loa]